MMFSVVARHDRPMEYGQVMTANVGYCHAAFMIRFSRWQFLHKTLKLSTSFMSTTSAIESFREPATWRTPKRGRARNGQNTASKHV